MKPDKPGYFVTTANFVTMDDGTGIVHMAPAFGEDDFQVGIQYDLPFIQAVHPNGTFKEEVTPWKGIFVKDADPLIIKDLDKRGLLEGVHNYAHQYPFCWRCDTPLLYYARKSIFVRMSRLRKELMDNNAQINWYPSNIKNGRFGNFLEEVKDWNLSRERYWGTPLPMWRCSNGHDHVIGSREEIRELTGSNDIPELHRPYVDEITFPCKECGEEMKRVNYVIDCWYDSGSSFFAALHYPFENVEEFKRQFPRDYIAEGIDQTRGWFYSLLAISTTVFDGPSYKNVICHALVLDGEGKKMSKSKGNVIDPWDVIGKDGADAIRWYLLASSQPWKPKLFSQEAVNEANRSFLGTLRNVLGFYRTYAGLDGYKPIERTDPSQRSDVDRWLLSRLNSLVKDVDRMMMDFDLTGSSQAIKYFVIEDLSNWYVRVNRRRFWGSEDSMEKRTAYDTLAESLLTVSKLAAPFVPFHSEKVYQDLGFESSKDSVHFEDYPEFDEMLQDKGLEEKMELLKQVVELGRSSRSSKNSKIRQPLSRAVVKGSDPFSEGLISIIRSELNVKEVIFENDLSAYFEITAEPDPKKLGPKLKAASRKVTEQLQEMDPRELAKVVKETGIELEIEGESYHLTEEDFRFHEVLGERWALGGEGDLEVILDLELTGDLINEGVAREVVRRIQTMRKDMDLEYDARISISLHGDPQILKGVEAFREYIIHETLADSLEIDASVEGTEWKLDLGSLVISII